MTPAMTFDERFPQIAKWITYGGWLEIGSNEFAETMLRALDETGLIWEATDVYDSLDEALQAFEASLNSWLD